MPVCSDLPMLDTVLVEVPNPKHPQGVKGVGEVPLVPVTAAVANASLATMRWESVSMVCLLVPLDVAHDSGMISPTVPI
jgi:hypothetical protein